MNSTHAAAASAFEEFDRLVCTLAGDAPSSRADATRWSYCRDALLASDYRQWLPGFVRQCGSVYKYREFIALYDPDPQRRIGFVEAEMRSARDYHADRTVIRDIESTRGARATSNWTF